MRLIATAGLLAALAAAPHAQDESRHRFSDTVERAFAPGGTVRMNLSAGHYEIMRGGDSRIRVAWRTRTADQLSDAKVRLSVTGKEADLTTSGPGRDSNFRVEIELPGRTDLTLRMTAGDLSVAGIVGHTDVSLRAGDLTIEVPDPSKYRHVRASVTAGDLSAKAFGFSTGGLFRKFTHEGPGDFDLRVSLWAGDLKLEQGTSVAAR